MMVVAHAAAGAAIGSLVGDPVAGLLLGTASHFVLDATPHFDVGSYHKTKAVLWHTRDVLWAALDVVAAFGLIVLLASHSGDPWAVAAGGLGGMLPDIVFNTPLWSYRTRRTPILSMASGIHRGWHWTVPASDWLAGTVTQIVALGGALWLLGF